MCEIQNNLCRYSTLKEGEHDLPLLQCGMSIVILSQRLQYGKGGKRGTLFILFLFLHLFYLFIFGCVGSLLLCAGLSLVAMSRGYSLLWCTGFSLRWLLLLRSTGSRHAGFSSCGMRPQLLWLTGSRAQAQ